MAKTEAELALEKETQDENFINNMFDIDENSFEEDEVVDLTDLDDHQEEEEQITPEAQQLLDDAAQLLIDDKEDPDKIDFEGKTGDKDDKDFDLASLNKKLNTDFKTEKELKDFFAKKDAEDGKEKEDELLEKSEREIDFYTQLADPQKTSDEALMRKQFETVALQDEKDLNDEDVKEEIELQIQEIVNNGTISLHAKSLRAEINTKMIAPALASKNTITEKRADIEKALVKTKEEQLQNAFVDIFKADSFYGVDVDKKDIAEVYKNVNSGDFLRELATDKNALAELAMIRKYKETIYTKASGLSYGDGMKAILDEFDSKKESKNISHAQRSSASGGSDNTLKGIISDFTYETPIKEDSK